jgi:hypothetical protein
MPLEVIDGGLPAKTPEQRRRDEEWRELFAKVAAEQRAAARARQQRDARIYQKRCASLAKAKQPPPPPLTWEQCDELYAGNPFYEELKRRLK